MITYICKYTPLELFAALGETLYEPNADASDFRRVDALIHSSVCTHAKMLIEAALDSHAGSPWPASDSASSEAAAGADSQGHAAGSDASSAASGANSLVLTNCCDSIRRVYDTLPAETFSIKKMLDLPHSAKESAVRLYAKELTALKDEYEKMSGTPFRRDILIREWKASADRWQDFCERNSEYIAILGARVSDQLRTKIRDLMPYPVIDLTCGGLRTMPAPPDRVFIDVPDKAPDCMPERNVASQGRDASDGPAESSITSGNSGCGPNAPEGAASGNACGDRSLALSRTGLTDDELIYEYAKALLNQIPCTRMEKTEARDIFIKNPSLAGVVYHSVKFCDYYSSEYAELRKKTSLPILKIESDFTSQSEGQLDTRLRAFAESLEPPATDPQENAESATKQTGNGKPMKNIYIGIDSGSTSTNVAAIDGDGRLVAWSIVRTGARAGTAAENALAEVKEQLKEDAGNIRRIVATGYGREFIPFANSTKTEISCHARGAHYADPNARTIIDIGGQDSKVICLDEDGNVMNFVMNDKCAAGTGRFLEMMAQTLEMDMSGIGSRGLKWKKDLTISSTCTVFAESEVVGLIAENTETDDIIHALNKSVASRTIGLVKRVRGEGPFMMTGGVAKNTGVAKEIERRLGQKLSIMEHPDLIGAIGAALFARI